MGKRVSMNYIAMEAAWFIWLTILSTVNCHKYKVVDLTHIHGSQSIHWPTEDDFVLTIGNRGPWGSLWYESNSFSTPEHLGTHLDSPAHLFKGSWRVHQIPIENLVGPGVIIDVKKKVANNIDYQVTQSDFEEWESTYGKIPDGAVVLMNSGWQTRYPNRYLVFNSTTPNDTSTFHFPSWHEDAILWLTTHRSVHVVGVDTPSNDYGPSSNFPAHVILGKNNIPGVENVANLDNVPASGSIIFVSPLKIEDGSGSPTRVVAYIPNNNDTSNSAKLYPVYNYVLLISLFFGFLLLF